MKEMWDKRYGNTEYAYGEEPNAFFKKTLDKLDLKGSILLPAEGEGRNAVYAAKKGLDVFAFDISIEGKNKALELSKKENVEITYEVGEFFNLNIANYSYDSAALIYAHFPPNIRDSYHQKISELIKPNGILILEGFSKNHLELQQHNPNAGGPKKEALLFSIEMIKNDFSNFEIIQLEEKEVELNEGEYHQGKAKVIRFIGKKIKI
jgi:SAM-dependent methyltransferase